MYEGVDHMQNSMLVDQQSLMLTLKKLKNPCTRINDSADLWENYLVKLEALAKHGDIKGARNWHGVLMKEIRGQH